jgi:hypothetical protein
MDFGLAKVSAEKVAAGEQGAATITVDSHPASADLFENLVVAQRLANHGCTT